MKALGLLSFCLFACTVSDPDHSKLSDSLLALPVDGKEPKLLILGVTPAVGSETMQNRLTPLAEYLGEQLKRPVELRVSASYDELRAWVGSGRAHIGIFSPANYARARRSIPIVPIASASSGGSPTYLAYMAVSDNSTYRTLDSVRGKRVAWVDRGSTSGYLYPRAMLRWRGFDPDKFFSSQVFAGNHYEAIRYVLRGQADVTAVASSFVDGSDLYRISESERLRVIAKSSRIPLDCIAIRADISRAIGKGLQTALLSLDKHRSASRTLAETWGIGGFVVADDRRYDPIEDVLRTETPN